MSMTPEFVDLFLTIAAVTALVAAAAITMGALAHSILSAVFNSDGTRWRHAACAAVLLPVASAVIALLVIVAGT